jgi:hypothetical protein
MNIPVTACLLQDLGTQPRPGRPGEGCMGRPIQLTASYFPIQCTLDSVTQVDVVIRPLRRNDDGSLQPACTPQDDVQHSWIFRCFVPSVPFELHNMKVTFETDVFTPRHAGYFFSPLFWIVDCPKDELLPHESGAGIYCSPSSRCIIMKSMRHL